MKFLAALVIVGALSGSVGGVEPASHEGTVAAWIAAFALAAGTLALAWYVVPNARNLIRGDDGRLSTSKFQGTAWTFAILFALLGMLYAFLGVRFFGDLLEVEAAERLREPLSNGFEDFVESGFDDIYLLVLGIPLASVVVSKAITSTKVASGSIVKTKKEKTNEKTSKTKKVKAGAQELIGDDDGEVDLADFQFLFFNLIAIAYFLATFLADPSQGLPALPDTLMGLTGVAAAAYLGKKSIYTEPPVLLGVLPPSKKEGGTVAVYGEKLLGVIPAGAPGDDPLKSGTVVTFGGLAAEVVSETDTMIEVKVPETGKGPVQVQVVRPPGAKSEELPFNVLEP